MRPDRRGMTLVELIIALSLTGLTLAVAVGISQAALTVDERLANNVVRYEERIAGEQLLAQLLTQTVAATNEPLLFSGTPDIVRFSSRCPSASGSTTSCEVRLRLVNEDHHSQLRAQWNGNQGATLVTLGSGARFRFLAADEDGERWHPSWGRNAAAPRALGVMAAADTFIYWVGPR